MFEIAPNGAGSFLPTNPDLADILGRTDFDFEIRAGFLLDSRFLDSQIQGCQLACLVAFVIFSAL